MNASLFAPDLRDFIRTLSDHGVRFLLVGGRAVIFHGYPRMTKDIDFFYGRDPENAACLYGALADFWGGRVPHVEAPGSLLNPGVFFQFGLPPNRIDLISTMGTVNFNEAWERRITVPFEGDGWVSALHVVSLEDLIQAKRDAGRLQDLADIDALTRPI